MHAHSHRMFSFPSYLCSILQTWRWASEGSGGTFGHALSTVVWIDEMQRDRMLCHIGQWLFLRHHLDSQGRCPSIFLLPQPMTPFCPHPLCPVFSPILSGDSATAISSSSTTIRLYKPNWTKNEENSLYIYIQCVQFDCVHTHAHTSLPFASYHTKTSSCPKTKGQIPLHLYV